MRNDQRPAPTARAAQAGVLLLAFTGLGFLPGPGRAPEDAAPGVANREGGVQEPTTPEPGCRMKVGASFQSASFVTPGGFETLAPGAAGGFDLRLAKRWSLAGEVTWTGGYGDLPVFRHDGFIVAEAKLRYRLRDAPGPYLAFGVGHLWDHDTVGFPGPGDREVLRRSVTVPVGFGWEVPLGDPLELRAEVENHFLVETRFQNSWLRVGVGLWYAF